VTTSASVRHSNDPDHHPALDGLRGCAVSGVLFFHVTASFEFAPSSTLGEALLPLAEAGRLGVDLFFVLSGFLITGILLSTRGYTGYFRSFYARRALRIFPAYYSCLLVIAALCLVQPALRAPFAEAWPWYATFLTNLRFAFFDGGVEEARHLWSLAVEEQFYLLWPLAIAVLPRRALLPSVLCAIALIAVSRARWEPPTGSAIYLCTWTRADGLLCGAAVALAREHTLLWRRLCKVAPYVLAVTFACWVVPASNQPFDRYVATFSLVSCMFAALLMICLRLDERRGHSALLHGRIMQRLGQRSYGIYLIHYLLSLYVTPTLYSLGELGWAIALVTVAVASYVLAELSYRYLEAPWLELKRHFPRPQAAAEPSAAISNALG
jgi:peptidoglycan/LPS O-acetylase OafA/YrhL